MATLAHVVRPFVFLGFLDAACGVAIIDYSAAKGHEHIMRSQARATEVVIGADGEMLKAMPRSREEPLRQSSELDLDVSGARAHRRAQAAGDAWDTDFCDDDYVLGKEGSSKCSDGEKHRLIETPGKCIAAAEAAGAVAPAGPFEIPPEWRAKRPRGCFKFNCDESPKDICYFFNDGGDAPQHKIEGTPICERPKYQLGKNNTNSGCPKGYKVMMIEDACSKAADCLSICEGTQFLINNMNASLYDAFPKGCFINEFDNCVYFNKPVAGVGLPARPKGTPICAVEKTLSW